MGGVGGGLGGWVGGLPGPEAAPEGPPPPRLVSKGLARAACWDAAAPPMSNVPEGVPRRVVASDERRGAWQ